MIIRTQAASQNQLVPNFEKSVVAVESGHNLRVNRVEINGEQLHRRTINTVDTTILQDSKIVPPMLDLISSRTLYEFTVNSTADTNDAQLGDGFCADSNGNCTLRAAVEEAIVAGGGSIDFSLAYPATINLSLGQISLTGSIQIQGPGQQNLTIDAQQNSRIFNVPGQDVSIRDISLINGRTSYEGGAIYVGQGGILDLAGVTVSGSSAMGSGGGGISTRGILRVNRSTVKNNSTSANGLGGGIFVGEEGDLTVNNSTINNNAAYQGGGINNNGDASRAIITNSTISENSGSGAGDYPHGGGILTFGPLALTNVTISRNTGQESAGGVADWASVWGIKPSELRNTIVAKNFAPILHDVYTYGIVTKGNNLIGTGPIYGMANGVNSDMVGTYELPIDPLLAPLDNNGGPTFTHALSRRSNAIDRGSNCVVETRCFLPSLSTDQRGRGFRRKSGASVDIGAYEVQSRPIGLVPESFDYKIDEQANLSVSRPSDIMEAAPDFQPLVINVSNIEELYSAVNNPQNAGNQIVIAPGIYMLSVNDAANAPRPNGGRLELQENMSLQGVVGDRSAVVIDAVNLPASSYQAPPIGKTGAIRMGRGSNSIEWLTVRNAHNASANIETDLVSPGTAYIRIAHIASSGSDRGIDVRNVGADQAGRVIEAQIIDNDLYDNIRGIGEGLRIVNIGGATGGVISATLNGNRSYNNYFGLLAGNNGSSLATITLSSSGDRFYENGQGAVLFGGISSSDVANGNTVNFTAKETRFENNNGLNPFDLGGLLVIGGENRSFPNGTSDNTVNVSLSACTMRNNQLPGDLVAYGARSNPESIGPPGTNNRVTVTKANFGTNRMRQVFINSIPSLPELMNLVTVIDE
ncbi:MAG: choice-of-anchor Q domain-containing protein [Pyrinomonadaceae bacterium]